MAARYAPARTQRRETRIAALAQYLPLRRVLFQIDRAPRHLFRRLAGVAHFARFYRMDEGNPVVEAAVVVHRPHRLRDVVIAKLAHHFRHGFVELAVKRVHLAPEVGGDAILARGQRVVVDDVVVVDFQDGCRRAVHRQLFVQGMQGAVGVAAVENGVDDFRHLVQPDFDRVVLHQFRVGGGEFEPRPRGRGHAAHEACGQGAHRPCSGVVVDAVEFRRFALTADKTAGGGQNQLAHVLPMLEPRRTFVAQRFMAAQYLLA